MILLFFISERFEMDFKSIDRINYNVMRVKRTKNDSR